MKIGLDIHGVIDAYPDLFCRLTKQWHNDGHGIYILTGQERDKTEGYLIEHDIYFDYFFSIVDHHKSIGTHMYSRSDTQGLWMDGKLWSKSKGDYADYVGLDVHFDDQKEYAQYFPETCTFVIVPHIGFSMFMDKIMS